jgi:hypothetical protein
MTAFQRSASLCGALLVLPIVAVLVFRANDGASTARPESKTTEPVIAAPVVAVAQPVAGAPRVKTPVRPAAPVAERPPLVPPPELTRDRAVRDDRRDDKPELAKSDPGDVERPARLVLEVLRAKADPETEEP